jgi:Ca2+-transporting ATPase
VLSLALHVAVIYTPFLGQAFSTTGLGLGDWLLCTGVASSVLWLREAVKAVARARGRREVDSHATP